MMNTNANKIKQKKVPNDVFITPLNLAKKAIEMVDVVEKSIALQPRVISYLIGVNNLTCRRLEMMKEAGYVMTQMHMCKVFKWFGMSFIVQFEKMKNKDEKGIISYDRIVWK